MLFDEDHDILGDLEGRGPGAPGPGHGWEGHCVSEANEDPGGEREAEASPDHEGIIRQENGRYELKTNSYFQLKTPI